MSSNNSSDGGGYITVIFGLIGIVLCLGYLYLVSWLALAISGVGFGLYAIYLQFVILSKYFSGFAEIKFSIWRKRSGQTTSVMVFPKNLFPM